MADAEQEQEDDQSQRDAEQPEQDQQHLSPPLCVFSHNGVQRSCQRMRWLSEPALARDRLLTTQEARDLQVVRIELLLFDGRRLFRRN